MWCILCRIPLLVLPISNNNQQGFVMCLCRDIQVLCEVSSILGLICQARCVCSQLYKQAVLTTNLYTSHNRAIASQEYSQAASCSHCCCLEHSLSRELSTATAAFTKLSTVRAASTERSTVTAASPSQKSTVTAVSSSQTSTVTAASPSQGSIPVPAAPLSTMH